MTDHELLLRAIVANEANTNPVGKRHVRITFWHLPVAFLCEMDANGLPILAPNVTDTLRRALGLVEEAK